PIAVRLKWRGCQVGFPARCEIGTTKSGTDFSLSATDSSYGQTKVVPTLNLSQLRCDNGNIEHARRNRGDGGRTESAIVSIEAAWLGRECPSVLARGRAGNEEGLLADAH